ncbi:hypothetical protein [Propionivibrio sp.]|uniref:MraY family glycosyltransferase n=1 Tax=Propionivibrio sp. TaxID=2212460 RepID=UPI0026053628|nr:hypothetical protein [Propionivibrio sp.]
MLPLLSDSFWIVAAAPLICAALTRGLMAPAQRYGLVDRPGGRKKHGAPTPLVGGLAIFLTIMLVAVLMRQLPGNSESLLAAMVAIIVIGVSDDAHEISHRLKFIVQFIAALLIVSGTSVHVEYFGDMLGFGPIMLGKWSYMVTAIAIVGLMNAINMIDGLDGLAGTQTLLPFLVFSVIAFVGNRAEIGLEMLILSGAIIGFLYCNLRTPWRSQALVFMGDAGGMLLGLLLAWYSVQLAGSTDAVIKPITAVWILALPLFDMGSVMLLRVMQRQNPFHADRQHMHYVLLDGGYSVGQVVVILSGFSLTCALLALQAQSVGVPEFVMFYGFLGLWAAYLAALNQPERIRLLAFRLISPRRTPISSNDNECN